MSFLRIRGSSPCDPQCPQLHISYILQRLQIGCFIGYCVGNALLSYLSVTYSKPNKGCIQCAHSIGLIIFSMKAISSSDKPYLAYNWRSMSEIL